MHYDFLIIGGGCGHNSGGTIRARLPDATIAIIGNEVHRLYSRVLLPHVVREEVVEEKVFLRTEDFYQKKNISYLSGMTVREIDNGRHIVCVDSEQISYGKVLIATGGTPRLLSCPGGDDRDILFFQTLDDARMLTRFKEGNAVVIGGGFIALELIMSFAHYGLPTTAVLRGGHFFSRILDEESGRRISAMLASHGVGVRAGVEIRGIASDGHGKKVFLSHDEQLACGVGVELVLYRTRIFDEEHGTG